MKDPITLTRTFSEFNSITIVVIEESPKFIENWCYMNLKGIWSIIKNFPSRMNGIHDNYNLIDCFDDLFVMNMDMRDRGSNLILYASIGYHQSNWEV